MKLNSWIREVEFVKWNSWSWIREFMKLNSWIREVEFVKLNSWSWKSWIREVEIVNSWSWNREFMKLKPWINVVEMSLPVFRRIPTKCVNTLVLNPTQLLSTREVRASQAFYKTLKFNGCWSSEISLYTNFDCPLKDCFFWTYFLSGPMQAERFPL